MLSTAVKDVLRFASLAASRVENIPIKWRCPEFFVLNGLSSRPFVPWPNYTQGESQKMTDVLNQFVSKAKVNTQEQMQSNE
ncbi:hypothetical protein [Providencia rettgeri]|uniref:hypothetical protein n=1 Tax=Providencia rettgeri TaxID=587 RepID=UPI00141A3B56|nr:hypothetical protein [Providencia rettgeri]NIH07116.1 hypothetical protein [Providencia rettgeri]